MHYYQFNIADYRKDTSHLTPIEHYIYRTLIDWYYLDEQPIPKKTQSVLRRLQLDSEHKQSLENVLDDFFHERESGWSHGRIEKEIESFQARATQNAENGKKGGRPKKQGLTDNKKPKITQSVSSGNPNESEKKPNQEPRTKNQEPIKTYASFDEFWALYPKKVNRTKTKARWEKLKVTDDLFNQITENIRARLEAGEWQEGEKKFIPDPLTYLNGKRWEDEIIPPAVLGGQGSPGTGYQTAQQLRAQRDEETFDYERMTRF